MLSIDPTVETVLCDLVRYLATLLPDDENCPPTYRDVLFACE